MAVKNYMKIETRLRKANEFCSQECYPKMPKMPIFASFYFGSGLGYAVCKVKGNKRY